MKRREFIIRSGLLTTGTLLSGSTILTNCSGRTRQRELEKHIIDHLEFGRVNFHWPRQAGKNARIGVHGQYHKSGYVKIFTNQGATGWALFPGNVDEVPESVIKTVKGRSLDLLIDPASGILPEVDTVFDLALHDLAGVILDLPVYKMLGAKGPEANRIYSGMIYFDELEPEDHPADLEKIMENCRWDYDYGYRQLKVKIGRSGRWYPHDEGLAMDIKIIKMIHEEFGDKIDILVDANDMYTLQDTIDFLKGISGIPTYWMEEPFYENLEESRKLKEWMVANGFENTYYADGERDPDLDTCMQLAQEGKLDVYLADIVDYGITPWRKLMPDLIELNTLASPHAWGSLLKTHYAAHIAAGLGNVCTLEGVTCLSDEIDFGYYPIIDGSLQVSDKPGFGMRLLI